MWDYDKLFAEGNIVGLHNVRKGETYGWTVVDKSYWNQSGQINWQNYFNSNLSFDTGFYLFEIQYIIRLDDKGQVAERLFDRDENMPKPMPELETGMFVKIYSSYRNKSILAFIYNNRVIYQDGEWDEIYDLTEDVVMEVYSNKALCFNNCQEPYLIWRNTKY